MRVSRGKVANLVFLTFLIATLGLITVLSGNAFALEHYDFTYPDRASLVAAGWDFLAVTPSGGTRDTEQKTGTMVSYDQVAHPGVLRIPCDSGDLWGSLNNTRNSLFRDLPSNWTSIRLRLAFAPTQNYQQAGLLAYQDDNNYVQVTRTYEGSNKVTFVREVGGSATNVNSISETATTNLHLRLDRDLATEKITAYYSKDGSSWVSLGSVTQSLSNPHLAIVVGASPSGFPNADLYWGEVITSDVVPEPSLHLFPNNLAFNGLEGMANPPSQTVNIFSKGVYNINWSQNDDASWVTVTPASGTTPGNITVSVNMSGLVAGVYSGTITVNAPSANNTPQKVKVNLVINPNVPVEVSTWKDDHKGALSVSVDDRSSACFNELDLNGFKGTFFDYGTTVPSFYTDYYNEGMELGAHLTNHICIDLTDEALRYQEIEPNIQAICSKTPEPCEDVISLAWPCGFTNVHEQAVASEYFLGARGYNFNQLEDTTPANFLNLKSFNSHEHSPYPPTDFKAVVDMAEQQGKWAILVFHSSCNDNGAIDYSATKDVWVAPIGTVIKYILQRDRFVLNNYQETSDKISFTFARLPLQSSPIRSFETAFVPEDLVTLQIDVNDTLPIASVRLDGVNYPYELKTIDGNKILFINTTIGVSSKTVEIYYLTPTFPTIALNPTSLTFNVVGGTNPANQTIALSNGGGGTLNWTATADATAPAWLSVSPTSGVGNATLTVSVNSAGLSPGTYTKTITVSAPGATNTPQVVNVSLTVTPVFPIIVLNPAILAFNTVEGTNPSNQTIALSNGGGGTLNWTATADATPPVWLSVSPTSGVGNATLTVSVNSASLSPGTYTKTITVSAPGATNTPQTVNVTLAVNPAGTAHYDFTYPDRASLLAAGWDFLAVTPSGGIRDTEQKTGVVVSYDQVTHPGVLRIPCDSGDLWASVNNTRNSLFRDLPSNWTSIRLKLAFAPTQNYQQAGLLAYQDDNNYVQVTRIYEGGNRVTFAREVGGSATNVNSITETATTNLHLRLDRDSTGKFTAYYSKDGSTWVSLGSVTQSLSNPHLAIVVGASPSGFPNADIYWAEVMTGVFPPTLQLSSNSLTFTAVEGSSAPNQTIALSNGGGGTLNWTATADATLPSWLSVTPTSGVGNATLTVSVNSANLSPGTYTKTITVSAPGATNSPQTVNVTLTVSPAGTAHYDFTYPDRASLVTAGWDFLAVAPSGGIRDTEQKTGAVVSYDQVAHPGVLRIPCDSGDLWASLNNTRNSLFRDLPSNWTSIRLKLAFAPTQNYQQAGLLAYQDDNNYVQVTRIYEGGNRVTFAREVAGSATNVNSISETATTNLHLRLDRDSTGKFTAYYSKDGSSWVSLGSVTQSLSNPHLAIVVGASPSGFPNADLVWVEVFVSP